MIKLSFAVGRLSHRIRLIGKQNEANHSERKTNQTRDPGSDQPSIAQPLFNSVTKRGEHHC